MAYVPGFEWDIFISYPHESNEPDGWNSEWVREFCRLFENEITNRLVGADTPKVFFDLRNFGAAARLEDDLLNAARNSALFVPIMSPRYAAPGKFTLRELEVFCESGNFKNRIVTIDLLPVSVEDGRPQVLSDLKRNNFYTTQDNTPIKLDARSEKYARQIQIVAEQTKELLQKMRKDRGKVVQFAKRPFAGKTVFLAQKEDDVEDQWDDIRAYLQDFGVNILAADGDDLESSSEPFASFLDRADLFIQLLSPLDEANRWAESRPSCAKFQYDMAVRRSPPIEILQWRRPRLRPNAIKYWDKELLDSPHVLAVELEEFEREIRNKLIMPPRKPPGSPPSAKPYIYITADDEDIEYAQYLKRKAEGERLVGNCEIIASKGRMKNFEEAIRVSDIIVVLYGAGKPEFIDGWLRTYEKKKATGAAKPPELDALFRAPPRKVAKQMLRGPLGSFQFFGSEDEFSDQFIRDIVEEFQRRRSHSGVVAA